MNQQQQLLLEAFVNKNQQQLSANVKNTDLNHIRAKILTPEHIQQAASCIQNGQLVAFPTQTVYGLGANALNPEALKKIYQTKKRPLTDPIIVHVLDKTQAAKLVEMNQKQQIIFNLLTQRFWPGPLTIILKANLDILPPIVTAQTGFVGIRAPKHPFARKLIQHSKLPIGAPSANLFSHVSPTQPVHVFNDFYNCDVSIVDGQRCEFGVESTVIKLLENEIHVLRQGSLSVKKLQLFLKQKLSGNQLPPIIIQKKVIGKGVNMQAPGQLLKHYAPYLPCYFFTGDTLQKHLKTKSIDKQLELSQTAFISFNKHLYSQHQHKFKHYFEAGSSINTNQTQKTEEQQLFCIKQEKQKMRQIYYLLRHCQNLNVKSIVIGWHEQKEGTIWDKIFRSTQGEEVVSFY